MSSWGKRWSVWCCAVVLATALHAQPPATIYAMAVGNWRNGPVVHLTPVFETTEAHGTPALIERVRHEHREFVAITELEVLRYATVEEGEEARRTLAAKYRHRGLEVNLLAPPAKPDP